MNSIKVFTVAPRDQLKSIRPSENTQQKNSKGQEQMPPTAVSERDNKQQQLEGLFSWRGTVISLSLLLILFVTYSWIERETRESYRWVSHTHQVQVALKKVLSTMQDAETGQRGFLLTSQEQYLEPFEFAIKEIDKPVSLVRRLTLDNPTQQQALTKVEALIAEKVSELRETVSLWRNQDPKAALKLVNSNHGKEVMDQLRKIIKTMEIEESTLLDQRKLETKNHRRIGSIIEVISLFVLSAIGIYVIYNLRNQTRLLSQRVEDGKASLIISRDKAEAANRAKSAFLSAMSHELRTPLNAILGFGQMLEGTPEAPLNEHQEACVQHIVKGGHTLTNLVDKILLFSDISDGTTSIVAFDVAIKEMSDECLEAARNNADRHDIKLITEFPDEGLPQIRIDPEHGKEVLMTFLSNAVLYNQPGGEIRVGASLENNDRVRISVSDTGRGIPVDRYAEVFLPFHRLDMENSPISGSGVGLAIAKALTELMGGQIGFESKEGIGTTFWMDYPIIHKG
ncbi:MAG: hypothetical protein HN578_07060 [Rhodospirillales bacterium]|jgi:signal transduction histidine kinase|nr:hypothetical protein [Rhodospirillales bacterium]MBT3906385.1 hypothetical protein [Rhodospirillaceae bacterium]MBT5033854.1 hypothetical protein [Rhodospirillaceae bacterium]MBT7485032.1 hypothetical protein [Rhodospirillales bacterium]MBT7770088.1 hypothetical protein [Rhodospirillales bacterium]